MNYCPYFLILFFNYELLPYTIWFEYKYLILLYSFQLIIVFTNFFFSREGLLAQNSFIPSVASSNQGSSSGKPKSRRVTRYVMLIRHGQYNLDGEHDPDRKLTALGREQARLTGYYGCTVSPFSSWCFLIALNYN